MAGLSRHTSNDFSDQWRHIEAAEKLSNAVILSTSAVILSAAKNLALLAQGKLREGSRSECFRGQARFFVAATPQNDSALRVFPQPDKAANASRRKFSEPWKGAIQ